jgi:anti-anti-sigma factor
MTLQAAGSAERWFDADSANLAGARQFVRDAAPPDMPHGDLLLSVSELVTNALLHARTGFRVRVTTGPRAVRVEVFDANPLLPTAKNYGPSAITGRGLRIVEHLSSAWGVTPADSGKWVWFEMARPEPAGDASPVTVALRELPVGVHARAAAHQDALQRELDLLRAGDGRQDVPGRLRAVVDELEERYGGLNDRPTAALAAAMDRGDDAVDLVLDVPPDAGEALARLGDLLDEADAYCREGVALMTVATPLESLLYRRWLIGQFVDQIAGAEATPWPDWLAAQDTAPPVPAPAAAASATPSKGAGRGEPPVVRPAGELDAREAPPLRDELQRLCLAGASRATLDLSDVTFIDSFGISVILTAHARFAEDGARLEVVVPPTLQPTFDLAGLDTVLHLRTPA